MRPAARTARLALVGALNRFQSRWTSGRRALVPAAVIVLVAAVATSSLFAAASEPRKHDTAARKPRPHYLLPLGALIKQGWLPDPALAGDRGGVGVPTGTPRPPAKPDPGEVTRQAPVIAAYRGGAGTLTPAGIATLALEHGCAPEAAVVATAIAMAESGGSPSAQGDIGLMTATWDWSAGLWQIRGLRAERNTGGLRDSVANHGVQKNAAAMYAISNGCSDWTPWSTFNNGAYLQFTDLARAAVRYVVAYYDAHGHRYPPVPAPDPNAAIPAQGSGGGAVPPAAVAAKRRSSAPSKSAPRRARPAATSNPTRAAAPPAPAPVPKPRPRPTASRSTAGPLPVSSTPTVKRPTLPVPLPTTSPPLPLPSLTLPKLP